MTAQTLVTPASVSTMATYNTAMNKRLYSAAARLSDSDRRSPRGAFWGSIHGTLNHLLWADRMWMSRFDGWEKPAVSQAESAALEPDFQTLRQARIDADTRIRAWAASVDDAWLAGDLTWYSGSIQRDTTMPTSFLIVHFFNHQTHHRGQTHALITAAGEKTGDTDLFLIL